jgi:hypothetical protein
MKTKFAGSASLAVLFMLLFIPVSLPAMEADVFVVRDLTGTLSVDRQAALTKDAREKLDRVLRFYDAGPKVENLGKIRLEFDEPRGGTYSTVFLMVKEGNRKVRVVRIFGVDKEPQMVAHKLTHAIFISPDKLVRNMMGIPMEVRFGNPLTFPMCGFRSDEWVEAFHRKQSYIPLSELSPDHEQWGMSTRGGVPVVLNKPRQHVMYAESGSFGDYLLASHGAEKMKRFWRLSEGGKRPWEEVFGLPLKELEARWLESLKAKKPDEKHVEALLNLLNRNPKDACSEAQRLSESAAAKK